MKWFERVIGSVFVLLLSLLTFWLCFFPLVGLFA